MRAQPCPLNAKLELSMNYRKVAKRLLIALPLVGLAIWFIPWVFAFWLVCGLIDVLRNKQANAMTYNRYFFGNGVLTWLLSPFNLFVDLLSYRNPGIYRLEDFPPAYQAEINEVLDVFKSQKTQIISDIDAKFEKGRRGMYVFRWFGKKNIQNVPELNRDFKYLKTIAVSVFSGKESTSWHYGPLRMSLRILYNLQPADTDLVFIECNGVKQQWNKDPLFIFDDTLMHRSVNDYDARRYNVFMDIVRPSPVPGFISALLLVVSRSVERISAMFYKNWTMIGATKKT
jgi:aspartyl/asparaginyl beta-hydroxylase (cupin superfamily)